MKNFEEKTTVEESYLQCLQQIEPLGRKNMLKGMAMEHLINKVLEDGKGGSQESIKKIQEKAKERLSEKYKVKKNFKLELVDSGSELRFFTKYHDFLDHKTIVPLDRLNDKKYNFYAQESGDSLYTGYKKCSYCGNTLPEKVCSKCNGAITEDVQKLISFKAQAKKVSDNNETAKTILDKTEDHYWCNCDDPSPARDKGIGNSRKCRKCGKGNFSKVKIDLTKKWRRVAQNISKEKVVQLLKEENFIVKQSLASKVENAVPDKWGDDGQLYLIESKNKEDTALTVSEVNQSIRYARALKKSGLDMNSTEVIYNGAVGKGVSKYIERFNEDNDLQVDILHIKELLERKDFFVEKIILGKNVSGDLMSENGEYYCNIVKSSEFQEKVPIIVKGDSY